MSIHSLNEPAADLGMIIVRTRYANPILFEARAPYRASSISENVARAPWPADLAVARFQGERVATVATALRALDRRNLAQLQSSDDALDEALDESFPASDP